MKVCSKCKELKELKDFNKSKASKDGVAYACRNCTATWYKEYNRTKVGLLKRIYRDQVRPPRRKRPKYTKRAFVEDVLAIPLFHTLHASWIAGEYTSELAPSLTKIDNSLPYTKDNIQVMTWKEHKAKKYRDRLEGNDNQCRSVAQLTLECSYIREFKSIASAAREIGCLSSGIHNVCTDRSNSIGGYKWAFIS